MRYSGGARLFAVSGSEVRAVGHDDRMKVLVIEHDESDAGLIGGILERELAAEVSVAPDAAAARRKISDEVFDIVTLECGLPDGSGLELLEDIAEGEDNPPVVVVSGLDEARLAARSFELGAAGYVLKDFELPQSLAAAVQDAFSRAALDRARMEMDRERAVTDLAINELEEIFCTLDNSGRLTGWNRRLKELTGLRDSDLHLLAGEKVFDVPGGSPAGLDAGGILRSGADMTVARVRIKGREGQALSCEFTAVVLRDPAGKIIGTAALGRLLEGDREAGSAADGQREMADLTFEMILRMDAGGVLTFVNEAACAFFGRPADSLLGTSAEELLRPEDLRRIRDGSTFRTLASGRPVSGLVTHMKTPAGWRYVEWTLAPIYVDAEWTGTQVTGRDITRHELTERFLRHVNLELDAYAHTVSHDLRGPLSGIMLAADTLRVLLREGSSEERAALIDEMARVICDYSEEAGSLVRNMLDLAERTQVPGEVEDLEVGDVLDRVLSDLGADLSLRGMEVAVDDDMGRVRANRTQLYQVFTNLVRNAVDHGGDREAPFLEVRRLADRERCHRFLVRDNGSGIPEDRLDSVFKPFERSAGSRGRGIGLATVDKLVKSYGGYVRAYNRDGACLEFGIRDFEDAGSSGPGDG